MMAILSYINYLRTKWRTYRQKKTVLNNKEKRKYNTTQVEKDLLPQHLLPSRDGKALRIVSLKQVKFKSSKKKVVRVLSKLFMSIPARLTDKLRQHQKGKKTQDS